MPRGVQSRIVRAVRSTVETLWGVDAPDVILNQTPRLELGELATPMCLGLAKTLRKPPRAIAEELAAALEIDGVRGIEVAGPGYINFHLDRGFVMETAIARLGGNDPDDAAKADAEAEVTGGKVIVEHTNINPNKAAHIGHLRNAAIGDTFVRVLRFTGREVEVQNYIDNTGVQVADVIVGFLHLERRSLDEVRASIRDSNGKFDYYCWDLYARVSDFYRTRDPEFALRAETLRAIEDGGNETAEMAEAVAMAIVACHLRTMDRIGVRYDVLPRESDILQLRFWDRAFTLLKEREAIFFEDRGPNAGCWVMRVRTGSGDEDKIIVRSNGTVTYVGKDIAYQLWKLGLLERDFHYRVFDRYADGRPVWVTDSVDGEAERPGFGNGRSVYNVIDVRQSYLQTVVQEGVRVLGYEREAERSVHFSYEMVALTPACAEQLGIVLDAEDRARPWIEVSGRKGQGVKADDLLDALEDKARAEVRVRNPDFTEAEQSDIARQVAVGALRYFLLRFTRTAVIAFDFDEALSFDGETGPYIQYAAVRANNILRKARQEGRGLDADRTAAFAAAGAPGELLAGDDELWDLVYAASRLDEVARQAADALEPATLAKFTFQLAQKFSLFYHHYRVISEDDERRRACLLVVVEFVRDTLVRALDLMGIAVPERM